jgi:hypothetical protein
MLQIFLKNIQCDKEVIHPISRQMYTLKVSFGEL